MSAHALLSLLLPPLLLTLAAMVGALAAWRGARRGGLFAALALALQLVLAMPYTAGWLRVSLEHRLPEVGAGATAGAIVVLGGDIAHTRDGIDPGPLTLERIRAGAVLHRRTGLPLLVTGGVLSRRHGVALAELMRTAYAEEFGITVRWVEPRARDTRDNAELSAAMLREAGIGRAFVVSHAWHLPRALEAFARTGLEAVPAPVRLGPVPDGGFGDWIPGPRALLESWYCLREWAGILVYRLRDG